MTTNDHSPYGCARIDALEQNHFVISSNPFTYGSHNPLGNGFWGGGSQKVWVVAGWTPSLRGVLKRSLAWSFTLLQTTLKILYFDVQWEMCPTHTSFYLFFFFFYTCHTLGRGVPWTMTIGACWRPRSSTLRRASATTVPSAGFRLSRLFEGIKTCHLGLSQFLPSGQISQICEANGGGEADYPLV